MLHRDTLAQWFVFCSTRDKKRYLYILISRSGLSFLQNYLECLYIAFCKVVACWVVWRTANVSDTIPSAERLEL